MSTISGFSHTACSLAPSGFGLPLPGLPADFTIDLLAKLWSSGTLTVCDYPLGNIIEFHGLASNPNDLDLSWREGVACLHAKFGESKNLLDVLKKGEKICDVSLIAVIHNSAKVWITYTEYTLSQKTIDGEINTICDFSNYDANNDVFCRLVVY